MSEHTIKEDDKHELVLITRDDRLNQQKNVRLIKKGREGCLFDVAGAEHLDGYFYIWSMEETEGKVRRKLSVCFDELFDVFLFLWSNRETYHEKGAK